MRRIWISMGLLAGLGACFSLPPSAFAGKTNTADFPLRVHILYRNGIRHYHGMGGGFTSLDQVDGLGQANLFENGQPLGFDFTYSCGQPITPQSAFDTFMARWKKPGRVIEILQPVIGGKPGEMNSCELKVSMKQDTVYRRRNGALVEESAAAYKQWMIAHQYDPEHGRNQPLDLPPAGPAADPHPPQ
jgi:hypothetical protein